MRAFSVAVLTVAFVAVSMADKGERVSPVTDSVVKKECGACHMVFPPQFLPQRSWRKLMDGLAEHFGENASLPEAQRTVALEYLLAHAADGPKGGAAGRKFASGIAGGMTPLRLTETPHWVHEHHEVRSARWTDPAVKSKANCTACHKGAEQGIYEEEEDDD